MHHSLIPSIIAGGLVLSACQPTPEPDVDPSALITAQSIEAHMRFLADDLLEGRRPGERGYDIAARYVESQYRLMGLEPGGDSGTYFAAVPLVEAELNMEQIAFSLENNDLVPLQDFFVLPNPETPSSRLEAETVFVGNGIVAPSYGIDSYDGVDVEGKIVVYIAVSPTGVPGDVASNLSSTTNIRETAIEQGAAGLIRIVDDEVTRYTFQQLANVYSRPRISLGRGNDVHGGSSAGLTIQAAINVSTAERLFEGAGTSYTQIRDAFDNEEALPSFEIGKTVTMAQATSIREWTSPNVIGILPGSDPELANETVVVTAHLDHIGICQPMNEVDSICNGALDNSAGTAIMMESARGLVSGQPPRRSVAFVALTAEESGLLGSEWLANNPTDAMGEMVANVNIDMPILRSEFNNFLALGADHSNLGVIAEAAVARAGNELVPDPAPERNLFVRSDQYSFIRNGIPALALKTGPGSPNPDDDEGQGDARFRSTDYHQPGDEVDYITIDGEEATVLFDQGEMFARINYELIDGIANSDVKPAWNDDSPFNPNPPAEDEAESEDAASD